MNSCSFRPGRKLFQLRPIRSLSILLGICAIFLFSSNSPLAAQPDFQHDEGARMAAAFFMKGQQFEAAGDLTNAVEAYKNSISRFPQAKEVHHALAKLYARTGQNMNAMSEFRTTLNIDYNFVEARNNYGFFLRKMDKDEEAKSQFKTCIQTDPKFPFPYYNLGKLLKDKGDLDGAIENFETATRLKPDFAAAQEALGMAIFERASRGDLTTAAEKLLIAEKLVPKNPKVHYHLGVIYATSSRLDDAESEFRKALMCDPRMAAAHFELGKLRYYRGDLDRALFEINESLKVNPTYTASQDYPQVDLLKAFTLEAQTLEYMGDLVRALETYQKLVQMRKSDAIYSAKISALDKQIKAEMKQRKKKPLPYDPEEVDAFISMGINAYEDGDLDQARASFERALELNPESFRAQQNLCFIQDQQGDLNNAIASAQKALIKDPNYDGAIYNLAYLLEKANLPDDAARMYADFRAKANAYPYDSQHIVELQQNIIREQKREQYIRKRGY
jgi:tetratricopeptide (TPR) repeat protein